MPRVARRRKPRKFRITIETFYTTIERSRSFVMRGTVMTVF
jgi:hypothetical protein